MFFLKIYIFWHRKSNPIGQKKSKYAAVFSFFIYCEKIGSRCSSLLKCAKGYKTKTKLYLMSLKVYVWHENLPPSTQPEPSKASFLVISSKET